MKIQDKRLLNRIETAQQEKFIKELTRHTPDARDKYDSVEIAHEPINLLQKLKGRLPNKFKSAAAVKITHDDV
ncbi:MAG: hypothetical protein WCQ99_07515 [Pseudomonadota bacterium]